MINVVAAFSIVSGSLGDTDAHDSIVPFVDPCHGQALARTVSCFVRTSASAASLRDDVIDAVAAALRASALPGESRIGARPNLLPSSSIAHLRGQPSCGRSPRGAAQPADPAALSD